MDEPASIEDLYRRHGAMVLRRARRILGNEEAARDAMQEVFVKVLRERESFRGEASPVTWLYKVTTNLCLNRIRDASRRRALLAQHAPPKEEAAGGPAPEDRAAIARLIEALPEELREIAVYYYVDEMNQDEIAELAGVSRRTIGNRLEEFKAAARVALGETAPRRIAR
jgi:RNA polymerase sigma factor (sigma-70 family)